jgi:hypothetical protein
LGIFITEVLFSLSGAEIFAFGELYLPHKYFPIGDISEVRQSVSDGLRTAFDCALRGVDLQSGESKADNSGEN